MSDSAGNWCLIESDPGVFSQLIKEFGTNTILVKNTNSNLIGLIEFYLQELKGYKLKNYGVWIPNFLIT